jgi:hypothetical protein
MNNKVKHKNWLSPLCAIFFIFTVKYSSWKCKWNALTFGRVICRSFKNLSVLKYLSDLLFPLYRWRTEAKRVSYLNGSQKEKWWTRLGAKVILPCSAMWHLLFELLSLLTSWWVLRLWSSGLIILVLILMYSYITLYSIAPSKPYHLS